MSARFAFRTAADLVAAYKAGRSTPTEVAERALGAAGTLDRSSPPMRLFIALRPDDVRKLAAASTARYQAGTARGPLDGVPVALKDEFAVEGYPTTCGSAFLGKTPEREDALLVSRLRDAGAVLFGKTNMHEFGVAPTGLNMNHGTARNPYDPARDTGGSSSGSGGAVASGIVPIAMGNDGGGSVRIPAAICGVTGIKGTYGRVPMDGVPVLNWSLEHAGPLGATVGDVVTAFECVTGERAELPSLGGKKLRIGVCEEWTAQARTDITAAVQASLERMVRAGKAELVRVQLPNVDLAQPIGYATFGVEGAVSLDKHLANDEPMAPSVRILFDMARGVSAISFVKAQRARTLLVRDFERAFEKCDVMVTPMTATTGQVYRADALEGGELDEDLIDQLIAFSMALNLTGMPGTSVPCGYDSDGMPIGLQVIGPMGADWLTLAVAGEVERETERKRPRVWHDLLG